MASKVKSYLCNRVLDCLKPQEISLKQNLSKYIEINCSSGDSIEYCLNIHDLNKHYDLPTTEISNLEIVCDGNLVQDVRKTEDKSGLKFIYRINSDIFTKEVLNDIINKPDLFGRRNGIVNNPVGSKVLVEFSSPNIAKPFHVGHLRSTIIGNFISKLHEYLTFDVIRLNFLGDWGTQLGLLAVGLDMLQYSDDKVKENAIKSLYEAYVAANSAVENNPEVFSRAKEIFHRMEQGDSEELQKWELFRKYSVGELKMMYERLGIVFTDYHWESMYRAEVVLPILELLKNRGLLETEKDGKQVAELNGKKVTLVKSDGSTLYLTRDIAAAIDRHKAYNFDCMIYVVENGQSAHFSALFGILQKLNLPWADRLQHVKFGRIHGMSTRKGQSVFLKDVLEEAKNIMKNKQDNSPTTKRHLPENTADILGMSAVIVNDLKQKRRKDYKFDWNKMLQVDGDTGIRLQYTHCRLWSLEKSCGASLAHECDASVLQEAEARVLVKEIGRFDEVLFKSYTSLEACILVQYLFQLCNAVNRALYTLQVKNQDSHIASQRLALFHASRLVLNQGMRIIGLKPLEEM